jgi:hypothetical protein
MNIFELSNDFPCIICNSNKPGKAILIGVDGTIDGNNEEAVLVHLDCIQLRCTFERNFLYQKLKGD